MTNLIAMRADGELSKEEYQTLQEKSCKAVFCVQDSVMPYRCKVNLCSALSLRR